MRRRICGQLIATPHCVRAAGAKQPDRGRRPYRRRGRPDRGPPHLARAGAVCAFRHRADLSTLKSNSIFSVLAADVVTRHPFAQAQPSACRAASAELFTVPGKAPLYLEGDNPALEAETEANVGIEFAPGERGSCYIPGAAKLTPAIAERLRDADAVLFDGTLFTDDEMILAKAGTKTGRRMGHMPVGGPDGTLAALAGLARRRILIHINNTNPILIEGSQPRRAVEAAGFEVAEDGMRIDL